MKQCKFSDHTADQVNAAQQAREDDFNARLAIFASARENKRQSIAEARERANSTWRERQWLAAIGHRLVAAWRSAFGWPTQPQRAGQSRDERVWEAGNEGETKVAGFLGGRLDDAWTLVSGYRNTGGEVDQILVGPGGVFTLEIKHVNGKVTVEGDDWSLDKYDKYGNLVERNRRIADRGGRSPSRQLNEPTNRMLEFLGKSLPGLTARRIVVLSHERGSFARVSNPTVITAVPTDASLGRAILDPSLPQMSSEQQARVVELLQRDHAHHLKRASERRPQRNPAAR